MTMKRPWYKRYPDHFISGTIHMTFEQKAAYSLLLDMFYANGEKLQDDDRRISKVLGLHLNRWKRLKNELQILGKLHVNSDQIQCKFEFTGNLHEISSSQAIENIESGLKNPIHREDKIERERDTKGPFLSQSAGARAALGQEAAPTLGTAPPEKREAATSGEIKPGTEEDRVAAVARALGRAVPFGKVIQPMNGTRPPPASEEETLAWIAQQQGRA